MAVGREIYYCPLCRGLLQLDNSVYILPRFLNGKLQKCPQNHFWIKVHLYPEIPVLIRYGSSMFEQKINKAVKLLEKILILSISSKATKLNSLVAFTLFEHLNYSLKNSESNFLNYLISIPQKRNFISI